MVGDVGVCCQPSTSSVSRTAPTLVGPQSHFGGTNHSNFKWFVPQNGTAVLERAKGKGSSCARSARVLSTIVTRAPTIVSYHPLSSSGRCCSRQYPSYILAPSLWSPTRVKRPRMNAAVGDGSLVRCFVPGRTKSKAIQCSLCTISSVWVLGSHSSYSTGGHEIAAMQCFFIFFSLIISPAECRQTTFNFFLRKKGQGRVRTRWRVCLKPTDLFTPANPKKYLVKPFKAVPIMIAGK